MPAISPNPTRHAPPARRACGALLLLAAGCRPAAAPVPQPAAAPYAAARLLDTRGALGVPTVDLAPDTTLPVVVDREPGQYLGHPTTVLLEDGRTLLVAYPRGHGAGCARCLCRAGDEAERSLA